LTSIKDGKMKGVDNWFRKLCKKVLVELTHTKNYNLIFGQLPQNGAKMIFRHERIE